METPRWTPACSVHEPHLDAQPQALFQAAARLLEGLEQGADDLLLVESMVFLRRYTLRHFITEEAILTACDYPDVVTHRAAHVRLSTALLEVEARGLRGGQGSRGEGLRELVLAILAHIQEEDQAYVPYVQEGAPEVTRTPSSLPVTGFPSVDRDHLCFLGLLEGLHEAVLAGRGEAELPEFLEAVHAYAAQHFRREELLMELVDYPGTESHAAAHRDLLRDLEALLARHRAGESGLAMVVLPFFRKWLEEHIGGQDLALVPYLQRLGKF